MGRYGPDLVFSPRRTEPLHAFTPPEARKKEHDVIAAQVAEYLANGGTIEQVPIGKSNDYHNRQDQERLSRSRNRGAHAPKHR